MDCARNIITANFSGGGTSATTAPLWQWDYGQVLCITGLDLPAAFEVHFSTNRAGGVSTVAVGADGQVTIPNVLLTIGKNLNAWIYLSDAQGEGETEYSILIPVKSRPMPETYDAEVSGEFDDVVRQVSEYAQTAQTAADNAGASASAAATSASEAAASVSAAETAKNAAETAQGKAEDAQAAAETAAQTATEKAQQSAQDAAQAALDAGRAESAAGSAESAETGAGAAKTAAEAAAQSAAASAATANEKATLAGQSATAAAGSASAAAQSAASIEGDVQIASQKASEAQTAAGQAVAAKDAAVTARQGAETAATNAGQSASTATTKAAEAAQSASSAAQSKTDAEAAATRAETAAASLTVDSALSDTSTNPVQNKVITGEIADVKSQLEDIAEVTVTENHETVIENIFPNLTWTDGYMGKNGTIAGRGTNTYRHSQKYHVSPGDVVAFANSNFSFAFITAFNGQSVVEASGQQGGKSYTVPGGIDGIVISEPVSRGDAAINWTHDVISYVNILSGRMTEAESDISDIQTALNATEYIDDVSVDTAPTFTTGAIDQKGVVYGYAAYQGFQYTQKIPITSGATVEALDALGNNVNMRWVCAYKGSAAVPASGTNANPTSFTLNGDIDSVVVTTAKTSNAVLIRVSTPTEKTAYHIRQIPLGYMTNKGSLSDGETLYLPKMNVKNGNALIFNANISAFSAVKIGKQSNTYVIVDDTNIELHNTGNPSVYTIPHGLTIGANITVLIQTEHSLDASLIRVSSDGVTFDYTIPARRFVMDDGTPYAISVGSTLTECRFSWTSKNINAPIWVFGDSYLSYWDTNWTKYLIDDGYIDNCMLNGFAGQGSETAYKSLVNLLETTTPKILVWCLGMNDPDSESTVSVSWDIYYHAVITLQKKYGFTLVLYTVPTTPTMNNRFKDAIIRESGYRYIEADKAVRINNDGDWIPGALQSDNVHPSAIGGNIIYNRILADLPEIMCNY